MPMWSDFVQKVEAKQAQNESDVALFLNPMLAQLPLPIQRYDDPFFPFGKALINRTQDIVCAYVFDLASYLALGAAGAVALERTIRYVDPAMPTILHGPFTGKGYGAMADKTGFGVDAITITDTQDLDTYLDHPPYAAFVLSNREVDLTSAAERGGYYWHLSRMFTLRGQAQPLLTVQLTTDDVLYAGRGDDFAQQVRGAIDGLREASQ